MREAKQKWRYVRPHKVRPTAKFGRSLIDDRDRLLGEVSPCLRQPGRRTGWVIHSNGLLQEVEKVKMSTMASTGLELESKPR